MDFCMYLKKCVDIAIAMLYNGYINKSKRNADSRQRAAGDREDIMYKINCEMLGSEATDEQAMKLVERLQELGYNVEYTSDVGAVNNEDEDEIPDEVWEREVMAIGELELIASVNGDDQLDNPVVSISVKRYTDEKGEYYDLVASNGDEVSQGGRMTKDEAIEAICKVWGRWNTFELIEE